MIIDFANDFADLMITYDGCRYQTGQDAPDGSWVPGGKTPFSVKGVPAQPLSSTEMKMLQPEDGQYISDMRKLYLVEPLQQRRKGIDADEITIDGALYQVYQASDRRELGGHFKAIVRKVQGDASA